MKDHEPIMTEEQDLAEQIRNARFIWIAGNGGSASTAEHFATDLVKKGKRAIALSSNTSVITMIAYDYGYANIFSKLLEAFASPEDLLITISCSGSSMNIVNALNMQERKGFAVYQFETFKPGDRDYAKLEDKHLAFAHRVSGLL